VVVSAQFLLDSESSKRADLMRMEAEDSPAPGEQSSDGEDAAAELPGHADHSMHDHSMHKHSMPQDGKGDQHD